tara:strand:- start:618 stop:887 length:270 start_codon:yes stop_codon:yes gene_type:complete
MGIRRPRLSSNVISSLDDLCDIADKILHETAGDKSQAAIDFWYEYEASIQRARTYVDGLRRWYDIKCHGPRKLEKVKVGGAYKKSRGVN